MQTNTALWIAGAVLCFVGIVGVLCSLFACSRNNYAASSTVKILYFVFGAMVVIGIILILVGVFLPKDDDDKT